MENDLISRKYVESIVKAEFVDLQDGTEEWRTYVNDTCENILNKVDNAPTVDLKDIYQEGHYDGHLEGYTKAINDERPQGEWVGNAFDEHHCNRCGHPALWEEEPDGYYEVQSRFCPNCGADMRGKEE